MVRNPAPKCGLGSSPFARRYLGNRCFFLFLRVLRCFSSPGYLLYPYLIQDRILTHYRKWVAPFGNLRIDGYLLLPAAYRSLSRPSSAPSAKAFTLCSFSLDLWLSPFRDRPASNFRAFFLHQLLILSMKSVFLVSRFNLKLQFTPHILPGLLPLERLYFVKLCRDLAAASRFRLKFVLFALFSFQGTFGGLGRTRTSDLTLIRRAL